MSKVAYRAAGRERFLSDEFPDPEALHHVFTGGSTGTPFELVQDRRKRDRVICDLICCNERIGWRLGDRFVFIRNWSTDIYWKSKWKSFIQNVRNVSAVNFGDERKDELLSYLRRHRGCILFGYASAVADLANYARGRQANAAELRVKLIVCDSDELSRGHRALIEDVFHAPVFNRYDNEENGLLGISGRDDEQIRLNTSSLYFELLDIDRDEPVQPGEIGRVVVTDLYNHAMPLIRYDTGDTAVSPDEPGRIRILEELSGRLASALRSCSGGLVSSAAISAAMESFTSILRYQVVQDGSVYLVRYTGMLTEAQRSVVADRMRACFGDEATIRVEMVESLKPGKNGKFFTTIRLDGGAGAG